MSIRRPHRKLDLMVVLVMFVALGMSVTLTYQIKQQEIPQTPVAEQPELIKPTAYGG